MKKTSTFVAGVMGGALIVDNQNPELQKEMSGDAERIRQWLRVHIPAYVYAELARRMAADLDGLS